MDIEIEKFMFKTQDEVLQHFFSESNKEVDIKPLGDYEDFLKIPEPDCYKKKANADEKKDEPTIVTQ